MKGNKKLCFNCLHTGHYSANFKITSTFSVHCCGRKHTKFVHEDNPPPVTQSNEQSQSVDNFDKRPEEDVTVSCNTTGAGIIRVALPIVPARVRASNSLRYAETYALLDTGSTGHRINRLSELQLDGKTQELTLTTLGKDDRR